MTSPSSLVATAADGTVLKVRLQVSPGTVGFNNFTVSLTDYSTGNPIKDATVTLGFLYSKHTIGESVLALTPGGDGIFAADGANLALAGSWSVTAQVATSQWIYDVPLQLTVRAPASSEADK